MVPGEGECHAHHDDYTKPLDVMSGYAYGPNRPPRNQEDSMNMFSLGETPQQITDSLQSAASRITTWVRRQDDVPYEVQLACLEAEDKVRRWNALRGKQPEHATEPEREREGGVVDADLRDALRILIATHWLTEPLTDALRFDDLFEAGYLRVERTVGDEATTTITPKGMELVRRAALGAAEARGRGLRRGHLADLEVIEAVLRSDPRSSASDYGVNPWAMADAVRNMIEDDDLHNPDSVGIAREALQDEDESNGYEGSD